LEKVSKLIVASKGDETITDVAGGRDPEFAREAAGRPAIVCDGYDGCNGVCIEASCA
jgi:hypothetical protein